MFIPSSSFIPSSPQCFPFGNHKLAFDICISVSVLWVNSYALFLKNYIPHMSDIMWHLIFFPVWFISLSVIVSQFSSLAHLCLTLCDPMNHSTPGLLVHHQFPESTQTHVHWVSDAMQPSHPLLSLSPALNLSQHQGLFKWVSSSHQVTKVLDFQLQHQSFQWTPRTDLL